LGGISKTKRGPRCYQQHGPQQDANEVAIMQNNNITEIDKMIRLPNTCPENRRQFTHVRMLTQVEPDAWSAAGFHGALFQPGGQILAAELREHPAALEFAGPQGTWRQRNRERENLWILWRYDRVARDWREIARALAVGSEWALILREPAIRALQPRPGSQRTGPGGHRVGAGAGAAGSEEGRTLRRLRPDGGAPGCGGVRGEDLVDPGSGEVVLVRQVADWNYRRREPDGPITLDRRRTAALGPFPGAGQDLGDARGRQPDRLRDIPLEDAAPAHGVDFGELRGGEGGWPGHAPSIGQERQK
jgi:hypothetical protein